MNKQTRQLLNLAALVCGPLVTAFQTPVYGQVTSIAPPSSSDYISITAMNSLGDVVGSYGDPSTFAGTGFIFSSGARIDIANCTGCTPSGINKVRTVVGNGYTTQATGIFGKGFVCTYPCSSVNLVDVPNAGNVNPVAINDTGVIIGNWYQSSVCPCPEHGFIRSATGTSTSFDAPNLSKSVTTINTVPSAINGKGDIAGSYQDSTNAWHVFLQPAKGHFQSLDIPAAAGGYVFVTGINNNDEIVGGYYNSTFTSITGFTMTDGKKVLTPVVFGSATYTWITGINSTGAVVGQSCSDGTTGCFSYPLPPPPSTAVPNWRSFSGTPGKLTQITIANSISVVASAVNDAGQIAGSYVDVNGNYYGFIK